MAAGWTIDETRALVGIWGAADVQNQLDGVARNRAIYEKISAALADLGYERTWQQWKTKVKNLTQRYRKVSFWQVVLVASYLLAFEVFVALSGVLSKVFGSS